MANEFREWIKWDYYGVSLLTVAIVVALVPFVLGTTSVSEYLAGIVRPSIVAGCVSFMLAGYAYSIVSEFTLFNSYSRIRYCNKAVLGILFLIFSVAAIVQGVYAKIPQAEQVLMPAKDWFSGISNMEWSYIAGVCALKVALIASARKWGWNLGKWNWEFRVEKGLIVLLAVFALAFAIWPSHLPDGMALKSGMEQALPYVALPVRFLGLAVYWPVCIALWALGFVGRMAVSLVLWIISLFM